MCTILVIDDEKIILELMEKILTEYGHDVETAECGKKGLQLFEKNRYDLVITDINMPDLNGFRVAQHIRKSDRFNMPIVCVTGEMEIKQSGLFNFIIKKPFHIQDVINVVDRLAKKDQLSV